MPCNNKTMAVDPYFPDSDLVFWVQVGFIAAFIICTIWGIWEIHRTIIPSIETTYDMPQVPDVPDKPSQQYRKMEPKEKHRYHLKSRRSSGRRSKVRRSRSRRQFYGRSRND